MIKVKCSTVISQPIEMVWDLIRDFNGHDRWHPAIATSEVERGHASDRVGCVRKFKLIDGAELREQLLALSDMEQTFSYCLLDTPIPLFNYVAHVRLFPVTDVDSTFWEWEGQFNTILGRENEMKSVVENDIYQAGFNAVKEYLERPGS